MGWRKAGLGTHVSGVGLSFQKGLNSVKWKQWEHLCLGSGSSSVCQQRTISWWSPNPELQRSPCRDPQRRDNQECWQWHGATRMTRRFEPTAAQLFLNRKIILLHSSHLQKAAELSHKMERAGEAMPTLQSEAVLRPGWCPYPEAPGRVAKGPRLSALTGTPRALTPDEEK